MGRRDDVGVWGWEGCGERCISSTTADSDPSRVPCYSVLAGSHWTLMTLCTSSVVVMQRHPAYSTISSGSSLLKSLNGGL